MPGRGRGASSLQWGRGRTASGAAGGSQPRRRSLRPRPTGSRSALANSDSSSLPLPSAARGASGVRRSSRVRAPAPQYVAGPASRTAGTVHDPAASSDAVGSPGPLSQLNAASSDAVGSPGPLSQLNARAPGPVVRGGEGSRGDGLAIGSVASGSLGAPASGVLVAAAGASPPAAQLTPPPPPPPLPAAVRRVEDVPLLPMVRCRYLRQPNVWQTDVLTGDRSNHLADAISILGRTVGLAAGGANVVVTRLMQKADGNCYPRSVAAFLPQRIRAQGDAHLHVRRGVADGYIRQHASLARLTVHVLRPLLLYLGGRDRSALEPTCRCFKASAWKQLRVLPVALAPCSAADAQPRAVRDAITAPHADGLADTVVGQAEHCCRFSATLRHLAGARREAGVWMGSLTDHGLAEGVLRQAHMGGPDGSAADWRVVVFGGQDSVTLARGPLARLDTMTGALAVHCKAAAKHNQSLHDRTHALAWAFRAKATGAEQTRHAFLLDGGAHFDALEVTDAGPADDPAHEPTVELHGGVSYVCVGRGKISGRYLLSCGARYGECPTWEPGNPRPIRSDPGACTCGDASSVVSHVCMLCYRFVPRLPMEPALATHFANAAPPHYAGAFPPGGGDKLRCQAFFGLLIGGVVVPALDHDVTAGQDGGVLCTFSAWAWALQPLYGGAEPNLATARTRLTGILSAALLACLAAGAHAPSTARTAVCRQSPSCRIRRPSTGRRLRCRRAGEGPALAPPSTDRFCSSTPGGLPRTRGPPRSRRRRHHHRRRRPPLRPARLVRTRSGMSQ